MEAQARLEACTTKGLIKEDSLRKNSSKDKWFQENEETESVGLRDASYNLNHNQKIPI